MYIHCQKWSAINASEKLREIFKRYYYYYYYYYTKCLKLLLLVRIKVHRQRRRWAETKKERRKEGEKERGVRATSTCNISTLFESLVLATKQTITAQKIVEHFTKLEIASKTREWAFRFCFDPRLVERWAIGLELSMVRARGHVTTISCSCCWLCYFYSNDVTC